LASARFLSSSRPFIFYHPALSCSNPGSVAVTAKLIFFRLARQLANQLPSSDSLTFNTTLTNTGGADLEISGISVVSLPNGQPDLWQSGWSESNTCGSSLPPGASCTITAYFTQYAISNDFAADGSSNGALLLENWDAPDTQVIATY
jgi:hypothetical protein